MTNLSHLDDAFSAAGMGPRSGLYPHIDAGDAFISSAQDSVSFGAGDEIWGGLGYAQDRLGGRSHQEASRTYSDRVRRARARLAASREAQPLAAMAGSFAGAAPWMLVPGLGGARAASALGRAIPAIGGLSRAAAGRGFGALAAQAALTAPQSAVMSGLYGFNSGEGDNRLANVLPAAASGAVLGAAFPAIGQGLQSRNIATRAAASVPLAGFAGMVGAAANPDDPMAGALATAGAAFAGGTAGAPLVRSAFRRWDHNANAAPGAPRLTEHTLYTADRAAGIAGTQPRSMQARIDNAQPGQRLVDVADPVRMRPGPFMAEYTAATSPRARTAAMQRAASNVLSGVGAAGGAGHGNVLGALSAAGRRLASRHGPRPSLSSRDNRDLAATLRDSPDGPRARELMRILRRFDSARRHRGGDNTYLESLFAAPTGGSVGHGGGFDLFGYDSGAMYDEADTMTQQERLDEIDRLMQGL